MEIVSSFVVFLFGLWLVALAAAGFFAPKFASRFLLGFASSARAHYFEQVLRIVAGIALILASPGMRFSSFFTIFGWILVVSSAVLIAFPWRWHRRFAEKVVPIAVRFLKLFALSSLLLGIFVLYSVTWRAW